MLSAIKVGCYEWTCMSEAGLYDSALVVLGLIRKVGSRVIALSALRISHFVILA